jgi:molybdopterin molybdotransferase
MAGTSGSELLLDVNQARQRLLTYFSPVGEEKIPISEGLGRILARPVKSTFDLPLFTHSSMDGFAVQAADVEDVQEDRPGILKVVEDIPAGTTPNTVVKPGQSARIMTGAVIPEGADAVVPVEFTDHYQKDYKPGAAVPETVQVLRPVRPGDFIRVRGQDVTNGAEVLKTGSRLRPQDLGLLAMLGINPVFVYQRPQVAIFSTGDELVPIDQPLQPGRIHDSNAYSLAASIARDGGAATYLGIARDREEDVESLLEEAADREVDLIISSAGVSVGAFDFVREVVRKRGELQFWRVNMRPGKPLAFGSYRGIPFVGLPGNPVSAFVGYEVFIRPAMIKMSGFIGHFRELVRVRLGEEIESDGRESYLRVRLQKREGQLVAHLTGHQGSGNLLSLVQANALLIIPSGVKSLPINTEVDAWVLDNEIMVHS